MEALDIIKFCKKHVTFSEYFALLSWTTKSQIYSGLPNYQSSDHQTGLYSTVFPSPPAASVTVTQGRKLLWSTVKCRGRPLSSLNPTSASALWWRLTAARQETPAVTKQTVFKCCVVIKLIFYQLQHLSLFSPCLHSSEVPWQYLWMLLTLSRLKH